jgi:hypothetical protein
VVKVIRDAVGQAVLEVVPNKFSGVEFRGVTRKAINMEARMSAEKFFNRSSFVRIAIIPEQNHGAA